MELDDILEDDLIKIFGNIQEKPIQSKQKEPQKVVSESTPEPIKKTIEVKSATTQIQNSDLCSRDIEVTKSNFSDIASLLQELLSNKKIEITITIKDGQ